MKASITVPNSLRDITLRQYQNFLSKGEEVSDEQIVSIFTNISLQEVLQLPNNVYQQALVSIVSTLQQLQEDQELQMRFDLNEVSYGMIPNLDEISYGENKDLTNYLQKWETMHLAMSVLYRPIVKTFKQTYSIKKYSGTRDSKEAMLDMPLDIVLGAQLFFYSLMKELLRCIPNYLQKVVDNNKEVMPQASINQIGEAMTKYTVSLKGILEGSMR